MKSLAQISLLLFAASCTTASLSVHAKLYRWVDDKGVVHYTDSIPPQHARTEKKIIDEKKGLVVDTIERKQTREEREAEEAKQAKIDAARKAIENARKEKERKDKVLLDTFANVAAIEKSRDERLAILDGNIKNNRITIKDLKKKLTSERKIAAQSERSGKGVPEDLLNRIRRIEGQIKSNEQLEKDKYAERAALVEKFDADIARFKELTKDQIAAEKAAAEKREATKKVSAEKLQGKWLMTKLGDIDLTKDDNNYDAWQFKGDEFIVWTSQTKTTGRPDKFTVNNGIIDLGHTKITIVELNSGVLKAKARGFEYEFKKVQ